MKAILDKNLRKYYKYVDVEWTQPTLTSNGAFGGNSMAVDFTWGGNNSHWGSYTCMSPNAGLVGFYCDEYKSWMKVFIYFPKPIRLTNISFNVLTIDNSSGAAININLYGGNGKDDNSTLIKNIGNIWDGNSYNSELTNQNYFQYYTFYFENEGAAYADRVDIAYILFKGIEKELVEGSADDYDFYREVYQLPYKPTKKYYKYSTDSTLINPNGTITSATGGNGWIIYTQSANYSSVGNMLDTNRNSSYPRWQYSSPNVYAYIKTPQKCIITSYLTTQWCDENFTGRICNHWVIKGYETEEDLLALINGTVIDDNTWGSASKGQSKTITLNNTNAFEYYSIQMVSNFAGSSYCSMGSTKFYTRLPEESSSTDYDYYVDYKKYYAVKG